MATFRSRQRANQRRDVKREPRSPRPEEGKAPVDPAAPRGSATPKTDRPAAARDRAPYGNDRPASAPRAPKPLADARRSQPATARGPRPDARAPSREQRPAAHKNTPVAAALPPVAPPPLDPVPAPPVSAAAPAVRRRLITPASEAPAPRQPAVEPRPPVADTPAAAPAPQVIAAQPIAPPPTAAPTVRRRLITPISEIPEPAAPAPAARSEIAAPPAAPATEQTVARIAPRPPRRPITPNIHAPDPRRGLPANDRMPTEHPVFERRSATPRLRGEAPQALAMFASCPRGLEPILTQELQRMQAGDIAPVDGGVGFNGALELLMRVNLESRVASRVLLRLAQGPYQNERDVNALAMQIDWPAQFDVSRTIKVKTDGVGAQVKSLDFVSLTVKDAICDRFRQAQLGRPNVDTREPDARIQVFLSPREASIYLDSSGEPLFKRGWRKETGEAPLRENLAAGILLLSGYNGEQPLIDPMCGSGTFLVEAGDIALNRAPGRNREFAFQKWRNFDPSAWEQLKLQAKQAERQVDALPIHGSDNDAKMVSISRANLERADLAGLIQVQKQELFDVRPEAASGLIVTNPPYGVRMDEQSALAELYPQIGDWLKQYFAGWTANLFSGDMNLAKLIRLSVKRRIPLYNGSLDCRIFVLRLIAGSARAEKP